MLLFDAFNKARASLSQPLLNPPLLALLPEPTPDPSKKALEEAEALKKLPARQEPVLDSSKYTVVDVRITDQKLRV
ncbi:hypothetical protein REPUB_Repub14bG0028900 [Reevesia pubescens]